MSTRRNSKRTSLNTSGAVEEEPAAKRQRVEDAAASPAVTSTPNGGSEQARDRPRAPSFSEESIARLPEKERSCLIDLPYPDQVRRFVNWKGRRSLLFLPDHNRSRRIWDLSGRR